MRIERVREYSDKNEIKWSVHCLERMQGYTSDKEVLHIVVGMDENSLYIITVYFPNTTKFEEDLKTRRRK